MKKSSVFFTIAAMFSAVVFNTAMGAGVAFAIGANPFVGALTVNIVGVAIGAISQTPAVGNFLMVGLVKEIWLAELMQKFRPNPAWLSKARDLSAYVNNGVLNLAEAGVDPNVILDYDGSAPIPVAVGDDTPLTINMRRLTTERDRILSSVQKTRIYNIMQDRVGRHNKTLEEFRLRYSGVAYSPSANSATTPVLLATGAANAGGFKTLTLQDVVDLHTAIRAQNVAEELVLVLNSQHLGDLKKQDLALFKGFTGQDFTTNGFPLLGFTAFESNSTATYNKTTGARKAFGAAAAPATDTISSFAFANGEVGYANGLLEFFSKLADPEYQADEFNYAQQFQAVPMRNKGISAIYSPAA